MSPTKLDFPDDCEQIRAWLLHFGWEVTLAEAQAFWSWHSDRLCASWLTLSNVSETMDAFDDWKASGWETNA